MGKWLLKTASVILGVSLLTCGLAHSGWLGALETAVLDTWVRAWLSLKSPHDSRDIVLVTIDDDYRELFRDRRPLDPGMVQAIIEAIAMRQPKVIGVELDTSDPPFSALHPLPEPPSIVCAQDAVRRGDSDSVYEPLGVLGGKEPAFGGTGIALFGQDRDGIIRSYRRKFNHMDSFPWAIVKRSSGQPQCCRRLVGTSA